MKIQKRKPSKPRKPCLILALVAFLVSAPVFAQTVAQDLIGLGMKAEQADYLAGILPAGSVLGNNTYLKGRNQANSADIDMMKIDATDDLVINSDASDTIKLQSGSDANRLLTYSSTSDTALLLSWGDGGTTSTQSFNIIASTSDADDDYAIGIAGGGGTADSRGAAIIAYGNEVTTNGGKLVLQAGDDADADMEFYIQNASSQFTFQDAGSGELLRIEDDGDLVMTGDLVLADGQNLAFTAASGANTACDTTCTTGCVMGFDTGGAVFVGCGSAAADTCVCTK